MLCSFLIKVVKGDIWVVGFVLKLLNVLEFVDGEIIDVGVLFMVD